MSEQQDKKGRLVPSSQPFLQELEAQEFWSNLKKNKLTAQCCSVCGRYFCFPPQAMCRHCLASDFTWVPLIGRGKVYSHVTYHRAWHPIYQDKIPYNVSLIELDEGIRMVSNVVNCKPEEVYIGMSVEVIYEKMDEYTLPKFRPTKTD